MPKISMEFIEGSRGIYGPIRVLFDSPVYEATLQACWHIGSYESQIGVLCELLRLQQRKELSPDVTAEDITELLVEQGKHTLKEQLWEFELKDFDEAEGRLLLKLVWAVNTSMRMRDVEFEARRLLRSPEAIPPQFQHPRNMGQAQKYVRILTEQHRATGSRLLGPREVLLEVVPRVLQGFWMPPQDTTFSTPSKVLSKMAVGVTKAVEDRVKIALSTMLCEVIFSLITRDHMVLCIQERVEQAHTEDVLVKGLSCFAAEIMNTISDVAAEEICLLFETHSKVSSLNVNKEKDCVQTEDMLGPGLEETVITHQPTPLSTNAEPMDIISVQNGLNIGLTETEEQPTPSTEPQSVVVPAHLDLQIAPEEHCVFPAVLDDRIPSGEPLTDVSIHDGLNNSFEEVEEPPTSSTETHSPVTLLPPPPHTPTSELPENTGLDGPEEEQEEELPPALFSISPLYLPHTENTPIVTAVQSELTITGQPVKVDQPFNNTTEVTKEKMSGLSWCLNCLQHVYCCILPDGDA